MRLRAPQVAGALARRWLRTALVDSRRARDTALDGRRAPVVDLSRPADGDAKFLHCPEAGLADAAH